MNSRPLVPSILPPMRRTPGDSQTRDGPGSMEDLWGLAVVCIILV